MNMYYTYGYETYSGKKGKIVVMADNEKSAWEKLSSYKASKGELHYAWLISVKEDEKENFFENLKAKQSAAYIIGLFGAALGKTQTAIYNIDNFNWIRKTVLNEDVTRMIGNM